MISALDAALESPQLPPEARDRIKAFLKLQRSASAALEEMRADVFVRRLIERIGLRRHRLFVATPEAAERLQSLSRLSELAAAWTRREPRGSVRDFVRHLTAVADAGELDPDDAATSPGGSVVLAEPEQVKGLEFEQSTCSASTGERSPPATRPRDGCREPAPERARGRGRGRDRAARARLAYLSMTRASRALVMSWPERTADGRWLRRRSTTRPETRWGPRKRSTRRSSSGRRRAFTPPTACFATRCSSRHGAPGPPCRRCAWTRPRT